MGTKPVGATESVVKKPERKLSRNFKGVLIGLALVSSGLISVGTVSLWAPSAPNPPVPSLTQSVLQINLFDLGVDDELLPYGSGSCFIVAYRDGYWYAVTAKHCVEDVDQWGTFIRDIPRLMVGDVEAELLRKDPDADVALIRIEDTGQDYHILELANPVVGEPCTTVGYASEAFVQFKGWVAGLGFKLGDEKFTIANSGLFPGCSGGPLLNADGKVIGVTVAVPVYRGIWDTVGCFVPMKFVRSLMETIE